MQFIKYHLQKHVQIIISAFAGKTSSTVILVINIYAKPTLLRWIILESGIKCNLGTIWVIYSEKETAFKMHFPFDIQSCS